MTFAREELAGLEGKCNSYLHGDWQVWRVSFPVNSGSKNLQDKLVWKGFLSGTVKPFEGFIEELPGHQTTSS